MLIQNISFIISLSAQQNLLEWLRIELPALITLGGLNPRLSILRAMAGADEVAAQAQTIAFQIEFCDKQSLELWKESAMLPLINKFEEKFGPEAVAFTSVFETVTL